MGSTTDCGYKKYSGFDQIIRQSDINGTFSFPGFHDKNSSAPPPPPANWTWDLDVIDADLGNGKSRLFEKYSLGIPKDLVIDGPNVPYNICFALLPALPDHKDDPGDCSTLFDEEKIDAVTQRGGLGSLRDIKGMSPCGALGGTVFEVLDYEGEDASIFSAGDFTIPRKNESDLSDIGAIKMSTERETDNKEDLDTAVRQARPLYLHKYPAVEDPEDFSGEVRLTCVHVQQGSGVMLSIAGATRSFLAWTMVLTVGFLAV
ncbi:hypothetical protein FQN50_008951 [Emmonsiellopsis sp. PD_5]|nr:hypothetical protein FQN50_008951 [Emmonsiellopsis sp. PD_5]